MLCPCSTCIMHHALTQNFTLMISHACACTAGNTNAVAQAIAQAGSSSTSGNAASTASAVAQAVSQASVPAPVQTSAFVQAIAQTLGSGNAQASATAIAAALSSNQAAAVSQAFSQVSQLLCHSNSNRFKDYFHGSMLSHTTCRLIPPCFNIARIHMHCCGMGCSQHHAALNASCGCCCHP